MSIDYNNDEFQKVLEGSFYLLAFLDQRIICDDLTRVRVVVLDEEGEPVEDAEIRIYLNLLKDIPKEVQSFLATTGKTDKYGCYLAKIPKLALEKTATDGLEIVARIFEGEKIYQKKLSFLFGSSIKHERLEVCCTTDRKAYLPGQTILVHIIALMISNDYRPLTRERLIVTLASNDLKTIFAKTIDTNAFGVANLEIPTCKDLPEGIYYIGVNARDEFASNEIELKHYQKPTISLEPKITFKPFVIELSAEYAWGKPVHKAKVDLQLFSQGKEILSKKEVEFKEGHISFEINEEQLKYPSSSERMKDESYLTLKATLEDPVGRTESLTKTFKYYSSPAELILDTDKDVFFKGEEIPLKISLRDPEGKGLAGKGYLLFNGKRTTIEIIDGFLELSLKWSKSIEELQKEEIIKEKDETEKGRFEQIMMEVEGDFGKKQARHLVFLEPKWYSPEIELELLTDKEEYPVGEKAKITFTVGPSDILPSKKKVPVFIDLNRQSIQEMKNGVLSKNGTFKTTHVFKEADWGICELKAYVFLNGKVFQAAKSVTVIPDKQMEIQMSFEKDCKPGQEIILKAETKSAFEGSISYLAMLVDEASLAVAPYNPDPFRNLYLKRWDINREAFFMKAPGKAPTPFEEDKLTDIVNNVFNDFKGFPKYQSIMTDVDHYTRESYGPNIHGRRRPQRNGDEEDGDKEPSEEEPSVSIRFLFPETAFWSPTIISEDGKVELPITLPHTISKFRMSTLGLSKDLKVGITHDSLAITQEFFVSDDLPQIMTIGDELSVGVILNNNSQDKLVASLAIDSDSKVHLSPTIEEQEEIILESNSAGRTSWRVNAKELGKAEVAIEGKTKKYIDVVKKKVEIQPATEPLLTTFVSKIVDSHEFLIEIEEETEYFETELEVYAGFSSSQLFIPRDYEQLGFCIDQTTDFLITNLASYRFLKHRQQRQQQVSEEDILGTEKMIVLGIQKLLTMANNNGWGWYRFSDPTIEITAKVTSALINAWIEGFYIPDWILSNFGFFFGTRENEGYWKGEKSSLEATALVCSTLALLWKEGEDDEEVIDYIDGALGYLSQYEDSLKNDPYLAALTILACLEAKKLRTDPFVVNLIQAIIDLQQKEGDDHLFWVSTISSKGKIETTALALQALLRAGGAIYHELIKKGVDWLMKERGWSAWRTDRARAEVLTLLSELESREISEGNIKIVVNSSELESIPITEKNKEEMLQHLQRVILPLKKGLNKIELFWDGEGEVFGKITMKQWFADPLRKVNDLTIKRTYDKEQLVVGDLIKIQYKIQLDKPRKRLVIREQIPPGFILEEGSIPDLPELRSYEVHQNTILFFLEEITKTTIFEYKLLAQQAGVITHRPTLIYRLDDPSDNCYSNSMRILTRLE